MLSLPNVREFDDADLIELPSNSKDLMALKYKEQLQWCCKVHECEEHKRCDERSARHMRLMSGQNARSRKLTSGGIMRRGRGLCARRCTGVR